jgi:hypothetical protein
MSGKEPGRPGGGDSEEPQKRRKPKTAKTPSPGEPTSPSLPQETGKTSSSGAGSGQTIEVPAQTSPGASLKGAVSLRGLLYQNTGQTLILVTQDKLELAFKRDAPRYARRLGWAVPLGILLAFLAVLVSANFKHEVLSARAWEVIFIIGAILSLVWFLVEGVLALKTPKRADVTRKFVEQVRGDGASSPIDFV